MPRARRVLPAMPQRQPQRKHRVVRVTILIRLVVGDNIPQMRLRQILPTFLQVNLRHLPIRRHVRRILRRQPPLDAIG